MNSETRKLDALGKVTDYLRVMGLSDGGAEECADALVDLVRALIDEKNERSTR
jgi:hypothetical protein